MATQVKRMNERMQQELDKLWESGELSDEKMQKLQGKFSIEVQKFEGFQAL